MTDPSNDAGGGRIGLFGAAALGIGGMIGAGIFSILGVVGAEAGSGAWIAFVGAGVLALFCGHSFAKLGVAYPSAGGPVEFLVRGWGSGRLSGTLNLMLWMGYVLALALYANAFAGYGAALIHGGQAGAGGGGGADDGSGVFWLKPAIAVGVVALFLVLNVVGSAAVGRAEGLIVAIKLLLLIGFVVVTAFYVQPDLLGVAHWTPTTSIVLSLGTTFLAYEGFGLVTNAAGNMDHPEKTLPRAMYLAISVALVVYVLVALATFGNLAAADVADASEYALAAAAKPALGQAGFTVMAVAALFSTASAINASLFGGANVSFQVARDGQMPRVFDRTVWHGARWGLFITGGLVAVLAAAVPLASIANTGSAVFLIIYGFVCAGHLRLRDRTGAAAWPVCVAVTGCAATLVLLLWHMVASDRFSLAGLAGLVAASWVLETVYRRRRR